MFRTSSIILNRHIIRDGHTFIILFTEEFGKIGCWWRQKKSFPHDIGDIIEAVIDRNNSVNILKYVEPQIAPREESWTYNKISLFLQSLSLLSLLLPEMSTQRSLFRDYRGLLQHMHNGYNLDEHHYLLFRLRVLRMLGYIGKDSFIKSPVLSYIFQEILHTPLNKLLQSKPLKDTEKQIIEHASNEAIYYSMI